MVNQNLTCSQCSEKALYREKGGKLLCQEHHLEGREVSYKTYADGTTYIKCPHCNCGDTCGTDGCWIYKKCGACGLLAGDNCPTECKEFYDSKKKEEEDKRQTDKCNKFLEELEKLNDKIDIDNITIKEYREIKDLKNNTETLLKEEIEDASLRNHIETHLKKPLEELENNIPQQVLFKMKQIESKGWKAIENCRHSNIHWRELFQEEEVESVYCLDCGEDKNASFTKAFQKWYCKKIERWLDEKGLKQWKFTKFLRKKDYYDNWQDLKMGKFFENIKDEFLVFQEMSKYIEEYCLEFAKEEGVNVDKSNQIKSNQIKSNQIKSNQIKSNQIFKLSNLTPFSQ